MSKSLPRPDKKQLEALIEEAIVDCYTPDEQHEAFVMVFEDNIPCPAHAQALGEKVEVLGFEREGHSGSVLALCRRKGREYRINVTAVEWESASPKGLLWAEVYKHWLGVKRSRR